MYEQLLVSVKNYFNKAKRTDAGLKHKLMQFFVDRFKLEQEIMDNIKPQIDVGYFLTRDYLIQEYCYYEHSQPQMKGYHEKMHGFKKSDLIFIEDGGNNEW